MDEKSTKKPFPVLPVVIVAIVAVIAVAGAFLVLANNNDDQNDTDNTARTEETTTPTPTSSESSTESTTQAPQPTTTEGDSPAPQAGLYIEHTPQVLSEHENKKTVYFFHASWCPSCQALNRDIENNVTNIPADTVIIKVDYDSSSGATQEELDLKSKHNVSSQHTLVQVNSQGNEIKTWSSSFTLDDVLKELQ
ncbi:MAG: thioredoxin domain-containing protein [Candidatus Dojkabacteria bacterium]